MRSKIMFAQDMRTEKINFTCELEDKEYLKQWAAKEGRTLSNLVERIVKEAVVKDQQSHKSQLLKPKEGAA